MLEESYQQPAENSALHLFRRLGRHTVTNLVRALLSNRMRAANVRGNLLSQNDPELLAFWREAMERALRLVLAPETKDILHRVTNHLKSGKLGMEALESIQTYLSCSKFFEATNAFANVAIALMTKDGSLRSNVLDVKTAPQAIVDDVQKLIDTVSSIRVLLNACPKSEEEYIAGHQGYIAMLRTVFDLYKPGAP